jgi:hypothetical protein
MPVLNSVPFGQQFGGLPIGRLGGQVRFDASLPALPPGFDVSLPALPPDLAVQIRRRPPPAPKVQSEARKDLYLALQA